MQEPPGEQPRHGVVSVLTSGVGTDAALDVSVQESELGVSAAAAPVASNNQYTNSPLQAGADSYPLMRSLGLRDPRLHRREFMCKSRRVWQAMVDWGACPTTETAMMVSHIELRSFVSRLAFNPSERWLGFYHVRG